MLMSQIVGLFRVVYHAVVSSSWLANFKNVVFVIVLVLY